MTQVNVKKIAVQIGVDASELSAGLKTVNKEVKQTKDEFYGLQKALSIKWDSETFAKAQQSGQKAVELTKRKVDLLREAKQKLDDRAADQSTGEYKALTAELVKAEQAAEGAAEEIGKLNGMKLELIQKRISELSSGFEKAGNTLLPLSTASANGMAASVKAAIDWESSFDQVRKTVGGTAEELDVMAAGLRKMSTEIPTSAEDLADIAANAGRLGIRTDQIVAFTRTMADLGEATDLTGEQAAAAFARFADITGMPQGDFGRLGSTIVALGNGLTATESEISDMALGLAAAGKQAGMSEVDILAFAAALSSVGVEADTGGTAFGELFTRIQSAVETGGAKLSEFASVAGMSAEAFAEAYREDAASAVLALIEGLGGAEAQGKSASVMLRDMEITGERVSDTLERAAGAGDLFRDALSLGSRAWKENTALAAEAEQGYATTASQIEIAKNAVVDAGIALGETLLPMVRDAAGGIRDFAAWFGNLDDGVKKTLLTVAGVAALLGPLLVGIGQLGGVINATVGAIAAMNAAAAAATGVMAKLGAVIAANPAAAVAVAIGLIAAAIVVFGTSASEVETETKRLNEAFAETEKNARSAENAINDRLKSQIGQADVIDKLLPRIESLNSMQNKTAREQLELNSLVDQVNRLMPGLIGKVDASTGAYDLNTQAIKDNVAAFRSRVELEALTDIAVGKEKELHVLEEQIEQAKENAAKASQEAKAALSEAVSGWLYLVEGGLPGTMKTYDLSKTLGNSEKADAIYNDLQKRASELGSGLEDIYAQIGEAGQATAKNMSASTDATHDQVEAVTTLSDETQKLASSLSSAAQAYNDLTSSGQASADTIYSLMQEYEGLISGNAELLSQYPELYAALDANNTVQENGAAVAKAVFEIKKAVLVQELEAQANAIQAQIDNYELLERRARDTYALILSAVYSTAEAEALARANMAVGESEQIKREQERLASINALAEKIKNSSIDDYKPKTSSSNKSSSTSSKEKTAEEIALEKYKKNLADIDHLLAMDEITKDEYYTRLAKLCDAYLTKDGAEWRSVTEKLHAYQKEKLADAEKAIADEYKSLLDDAAYYHELGLLDDVDYYVRKRDLRDKYLKEDSSEWRSATLSIRDDLQSIRNAELQRMQAEREAKEQELSAWKEMRIAQIEAETAAEEKRVNAVIDGINKEIEARRKLREDEDLDKQIADARKRLDAAKAQLSFARTDAERAELEKEVIRKQNDLDAAVQNKTDSDWYAAQEAAKATLQEQLALTKELAEAEKARVQSALSVPGAQAVNLLNTANATINQSLAQVQAAAANNTYNQQSASIHVTNMQGVLTSAQLQWAVEKALAAMR